MIAASSISIKNSNSFTSLLDIFYPVGGIYLTTSDTNPAENLGGTWVEIKDALLAAAGETYTSAANANGGATTISVDQIPSHTHTMEHTHPGPSHTHALAGTGALAVEWGAHGHDIVTGNGKYIATYEKTVAPSSGTWNGVFDSKQSVDPLPSGAHHSVMARTNGAHTHNLTGSTKSAGSNNTGAASNSTTSSVGGGGHSLLTIILSEFGSVLRSRYELCSMDGELI